MTQPVISLDDIAYGRAVSMITAATLGATQANDGDPTATVRALAYVLSMYLDADAELTTAKGIRERGEEIGRVVAGQIQSMREERKEMGEPVLHAVVRQLYANQPAAH